MYVFSIYKKGYFFYFGENRGTNKQSFKRSKLMKAMIMQYTWVVQKITKQYCKIKFPMTSKANIDVKQAHKLISEHKTDPNFVLLDVRTMAQYGMSHIQGAINISVSDIEGKLSELDKNKRYLVYCRSGARSNSASNTLRSYGFEQVTNMSGGISSWNAQNYETTSNCCILM